LVSFHCGQEADHPLGYLIDLAETVRIADRQTRWYDWERYSKRQGKRMKLGGLLGEVTYEGDLEPFMPLLVLGSWVNMGKGTSFGLGRYRIEAI
jgi:CRISPR/Cas system endoribonuclease Cas6 (RAMP superfamily)